MSIRGQVKVAFVEGGEEAAHKVATKLGVKPGRFKRWIKLFSGVTEPKAKRATQVARAPRSVDRQGLGRFYIFGDPTQQGHIVVKGPEQSEVKFDNGNTACVPNHWLTML